MENLKERHDEMGNKYFTGYSAGYDQYLEIVLNILIINQFSLKLDQKFLTIYWNLYNQAQFIRVCARF